MGSSNPTTLLPQAATLAFAAMMPCLFFINFAATSAGVPTDGTYVLAGLGAAAFVGIAYVNDKRMQYSALLVGALVADVDGLRDVFMDWTKERDSVLANKWPFTTDLTDSKALATVYLVISVTMMIVRVPLLAMPMRRARAFGNRLLFVWSAYVAFATTTGSKRYGDETLYPQLLMYTLWFLYVETIGDADTPLAMTPKLGDLLPCVSCTVIDA